MKAAATKVEAAVVEAAEVEATVEMTALATMAAEKQHRWAVVVVATAMMNCAQIGQQRGGCTIVLSAAMCRKSSEGALENEGEVEGRTKPKSKQRSSSKEDLAD